jgi:hypothetical protein
VLRVSERTEEREDVDADREPVRNAHDSYL